MTLELKELAALDLIEYREANWDGENIYVIADPNNVTLGAKEMLNTWYSTVKEHDFTYDFFNVRSRAFSQLVWKETKSIGVGIGRIG